MIKIRLINQELDLEAEIIIQVVMIIEQQDIIMMIGYKIIGCTV